MKRVVVADDLVLAYLAGIVDADGYISITKFPRVQGLYHSARVGIAGTRNAPHELASSIFGGRVCKYANRGHRPQYQWSRQGANAVLVIEALLPHLRVKRAQAILAIDLQTHVANFDRSPRRVSEREQMREQMVFVLNEGRGIKR